MRCRAPLSLRLPHTRPQARGGALWIAGTATTFALSAASLATAAETLRVEGSDTLRPIVRELSEAFRHRHADFDLEIGGRGSSTGAPALLAGRAEIAAMSRPLNAAELRAFERRTGAAPRVVTLALDAVVIYVNEENPLERLTLAELDAVFSKSLRCGGKALQARHWGDLGAKGAWAERRIQVFGRGVRSGTRSFLRDEALCGGLFRDDLRERPGPDSLALSVAESRYGIGYGSLAQLRTRGVKSLALALREGGPYFTPGPESVTSRAYPLTRRLELVAVETPEEPLAPAVEAFLGFASSEEGRAIVAAYGYVPPPDTPDRESREPRLQP